MTGIFLLAAPYCLIWHVVNGDNFGGGFRAPQRVNSGFGTGNSFGVPQGVNSAYGTGNSFGEPQGKNPGYGTGNSFGVSQGGSSGFDAENKFRDKPGSCSGFAEERNSRFGRGSSFGRGGGFGTNAGGSRGASGASGGSAAYATSASSGRSSSSGGSAVYGSSASSGGSVTYGSSASSGGSAVYGSLAVSGASAAVPISGFSSGQQNGGKCMHKKNMFGKGDNDGNWNWRNSNDVREGNSGNQQSRNQGQDICIGRISQKEARQIRKQLQTYAEPEEMEAYSTLLQRMMKMQSDSCNGGDVDRMMSSDMATVRRAFKELARMGNENGMMSLRRRVIQLGCLYGNCPSMESCVQIFLLRLCMRDAGEDGVCSMEPGPSPKIYYYYPPCQKKYKCTTRYIEPTCEKM